MSLTIAAIEIPILICHTGGGDNHSPSNGRSVDSSRFFVILNRELLCRLSFFISGITKLMGFVSGVTGGVLLLLAVVVVVGVAVAALVGLVLLVPPLLVVAAAVAAVEFVCDGKA